MKKIFKISKLQSVIRNSPSPYSSPLRGEGRGEGAGFTLIEIAVVLVILGLLVALGASMMGPLTKRAKVIESREAVKAAKEALLGYVVKNGYLPTTIGPSGGRELDAWGRSLIYYVPTSLGGACTGTCTGSVCSTGVGSCGICNLTSTDRTIFECTNTACTTYNTKSNIAFIVYSTGEDAEGTGTTTQPTGGPACPSGTCYWIREQVSDYTVGATTYQYDDIVQYVTLDEIRSARSCSFTVTTQSLPDAKVGTAYNVTGVQFQASGGQTPYTSWATGQAQGACAAGRVRLVASDIGLCLTTASGLISGTPTTAGVHNFTVTLTDANSVQTSKAFTLNVIETLAITNQTLPDAKTGNAYSVTLSGTGGTTPYTWSTGQAQGSCPATEVQINASNTGLCLDTATGVLSSSIVATPYPIAPGVYNFTVTITDANSKTNSRAFTLNVIDSCFSTGINILNSTGGGNDGYKQDSGACTQWSNNTNLNVQPVYTMQFYNNTSCANQQCTTQTLNYSFFLNIDADKDCSISWTGQGATCTFGDL